MKRIFIVILFLITQLCIVKSQIGNEFWFAAPDISSDHANDSRPLYLYVTALHETDVTISRPADDSFTPVEYELAANETKIIQLDNNTDFGNLDVIEIETYAKDGDADDFVQDKGFLIESSDGEISAYYLPSAVNNSDIIALKAENALGTDFWVSTQRKYKNYPYYLDYSGFNIVATEDNTTVTVYFNGNNVEFFETETSHTFTLNKGECVAFSADYETGQAAANHLFGIHVVSSQNIAINFYDDSMTMDDYSTLGYYSSWDIMADQIVPTSLIGEEYIALRGWVWDRSTTDVDGEAVFVTPTVDGTDIYINGTLMASNLDAGDYFEYTIEDAATYIKGTQPIYVNHVTGYANENSYTIENASRELGGAILPSVDLCAGSYSVTVRKEEASSFAFYFNKLIVRCDTSGDPTEAINGFTYYIDDVNQGQIDPDHFTFIMDSAFAYYDPSKAIDLGELPYYENVEDEQTLRVENSSARFHLGVVYASKSPGCRYAYSSDYANGEPDAGIGGAWGPKVSSFCDLEPVQLVAYGGTSYEWTGYNEDGESVEFDNETIADPVFTPDKTGTYTFNVVITGECFVDTTITLRTEHYLTPNADFELSDTVGCSSLNVMITNTTENSEDFLQVYKISVGVGLFQYIDLDTMSSSFNFEFPDNYTDTIQKYLISLLASNAGNLCPVVKSDTVSVLPDLRLDFELADTQYCAYEDIQITGADNSENQVADFTWYFSDGTQSIDELPQKTFVNYTDTTQVQSVSLKINAELTCNDSVTKYISVLPQNTKADFTFSDTVACPGTVITLTNTTEKADYVKWYISDTLFNSDALNSLAFTSPENYTGDTLDVKISMHSYSNAGCDFDTTAYLYVKPGLSASIDYENATDCKTSEVQFSGSVTGSDNASYAWFIEGAPTSTEASFAKEFLNLTEKADTQSVILMVSEDGFCPDTIQGNVVIFPQIYIEQNPVLEEACTPATILLQSDSVLNVDNINWVVTSLSDTFNVVLGATTPYTYTIDSLGEISREYTIQAIASNSYNCTDTSSIYSMELLQTPKSHFSFSENPVESGTEVVVYNESSFASEYLWDLGNSTSGEEQLVVQYEVEDSSNYLFSLIAYNESCSDTSMKTLLVYPEVSAEDTTGQSGSSDTTGLGGTGIDDTELSVSAKVYLKSKMITVSWPYDAEYADLTLIDMSGRQRSTLSTMLTNGENITDMSFNANEVYLLQVKTDKRTLMFKVVR